MTFDKNIYYRDRMRSYLHTSAVCFEEKLKDIAEGMKQTTAKEKDIKKVGKQIEIIRNAIFKIDDLVYTMFKKEKNG
jgi:hypothetical protein